ncbi:MAG TPA: hypothetical protein VM598_14030, partial [Bdellovibrionota bacterium]|nr:hypothetical protein [Bdellovibrionota bacterium]
MAVRGPGLVLCFFVCAAVLGCERQTAKSGNLSASVERTPAETPVVGVAMEDFSACHPQGSALAGCLTSRGVLPTGWAQADFDQCLTAANPTALDAASCLSSRGLTIFHHRAPFQTDFETCGVRAGNAKIAGCLNKNGLLPTALTQEQINGCVATNGGVAGIEKCLRARGFLPRKAALFQADFNLCDKVDGTGRIATCLFNNDLVPATVTQANVDTCITNAGIGSAVRCLRNNRLVNNALMQAHIGLCAAAVGQAGVAAC